MFRLLLLIAAAALTAGPVAVAQPPAATAPAFDPAIATAAIDALADALARDFLYPAVGRRYAAMLRAKLKNGSYAGFTDAAALAERVTADLQAIHRDGHLRLQPPATSAPRPAGARMVRPAPLEQAGWIAPGIAYVRINVFPGEPKVAAELAAFLNAHTGAKALILDVRTHGGGEILEMDEILRRLYAEPATVMVMDTRASVVRDDDDLETATLHRVPGPAGISRAEHRIAPLNPASSLTKARVYLLTSARTASAGEHLTSVLKETHRATLIGATTAGAGNFGATVALPGGWSAFVAHGHSYYPGTPGWEQTGVAPDVAVAPERALVVALEREGVTAEEAARLSEAHRPRGAMTRLGGAR